MPYRRKEEDPEVEYVYVYQDPLTASTYDPDGLQTILTGGDVDWDDSSMWDVWPWVTYGVVDASVAGPVWADMDKDAKTIWYEENKDLVESQLGANPWHTLFGDYDQDGVSDSNDNCMRTYNARQGDYDGDGIGDMCDNCVTLWNEKQDDLDDDLIGDLCDDDVDGDGYLNHEDECPNQWGIICLTKSHNQLQSDYAHTLDSTSPIVQNKKYNNLENNNSCNSSSSFSNNFLLLFFLFLLFNYGKRRNR